MEQDDLLSRLAKKAKRKLNKEEEKPEHYRDPSLYKFVKSSRSEERKKLEKKIVQLLKNNPDCLDPIGKLIDHSVYDGLSEEKKQAYVMRLSQEYSQITKKLNAL